MVIKNVSLDIVCGITSKLPDTNRPEVAFAGKSNVGKSSLINGLMNRKSLARTSSTPGKTRQINFYNIDKNFYFVDLPGYGYSKMSKQEQEQVGKFIEDYLENRKQIKLIIFLIDSRHAPSENDMLMYNYIINSGFSCIVVANKVDKFAPSKVDAAVSELQQLLNPLKDLTFLPFSSERKIYVESTWEKIEQFLS